MQWDNPRLAFPKADQYAFLFENAHLLLLSWERDDAKFLFLIREQREEGLVLDYPGAAFTHRVMDTIENIFFVQLQEEGQEPKRYVLGSYFVADKQPYGAYYEHAGANPDVILLRIDGEPPELSLTMLDGDELQRASAAFAESHEEFLAIAAANHEA